MGAQRGPKFEAIIEPAFDRRREKHIMYIDTPRPGDLVIGDNIGRTYAVVTVQELPPAIPAKTIGNAFGWIAAKTASGHIIVRREEWKDSAEWEHLLPRQTRGHLRGSVQYCEGDNGDYVSYSNDRTLTFTRMLGEGCGRRTQSVKI